jgi:hypothetical protein
MRWVPCDACACVRVRARDTQIAVAAPRAFLRTAGSVGYALFSSFAQTDGRTDISFRQLLWVGGIPQELEFLREQSRPTRPGSQHVTVREKQTGHALFRAAASRLNGCLTPRQACVII